MNKSTSRWMYWTPRILCILFAGFLAIFAMDVFEMQLGFSQRALALLMHLIPTGLVLLGLSIVWRREWIGAVLFPLMAAIHCWSMWGRLDWSAYALIEGPLILLGILFWINWRNRMTLSARLG